MQLQRRIAPLPAVPDPLRPPLNIFSTLLKAPELNDGFLALGAHLLRGDALPPREREIVILRVGWRSDSEYEFGQHTRIGLGVGLNEAEVAALAGVGEHAWSDDDAALVALADELCAANVVGQPTWDALARRWSEPELLELLVLAGYYRLVSGMLNSAGIALEPGTPGWPAGAVTALSAPRDAAPGATA